MTYILKYNSVTITKWMNLSWDNSTGGLKIASFDVFSQHFQDLATWESRIYSSLIEIFNGEVLEFQGYIRNCFQSENIIHVDCISIIDKLNWDVVEESIKFIVDEVNIASAPSTVYLVVETDEEESPSWVFGQYISPRNYYAIVSDKTDGAVETELIDDATPISSYDDCALTDNALAKITAVDADKITIDEIIDGAYIQFTLSSADLPNANIPTTITIKCAMKINLDVAVTNPGYRVDWIKGTTVVETIQSETFTAGYEHIIYFEKVIQVSDPDVYFADGAFYKLAYLRITFLNPNTVDLDFTNVYLDYLSVLVNHETQTFEPLNRRIYSNDTNNLTVYNDDEDNALTVQDTGIAAGDKVTISMKFNDAIAGANGTDIIVSVPEIKKGVSQTYANINQLTAIQNLFDEFNLQYSETITDNLIRLTAVDEDDVAAATITYDKDNDPPLWDGNIKIEDNIYGSVKVKYKNGITAKIYADTPASDPRCKIIDANWILTKAGAIEYGTKKANYYSVPHRSIELKWDGYITNVPAVLTKYNINIYKYNSTTSALDDYEFEDQICRRVVMSIASPSATPHYEAFLGGGSTPPDEMMGKWMGGQDRKWKTQSGTQDTSYYSAITRFYQLDGIPPSFTPSEHGNEAHSSTFVDAAGSVSAMGVKADENPLNHDKYIHPTTSGNKHVPSGGSANQFLRYDSDGVAKWETVSIPVNGDFSLSGLSEKSYTNLTDKPTIPTKYTSKTMIPYTQSFPDTSVADGNICFVNGGGYPPIYFGKTSSAKSMNMYLKIPSNYKSGTDLKLYCNCKYSSLETSRTITYSIKVLKHPDGQSHATFETATATYTSGMQPDDNLPNSSVYDMKYLLLTNADCSWTAGDEVQLRITLYVTQASYYVMANFHIECETEVILT
jgi:hypothetical protein